VDGPGTQSALTHLVGVLGDARVLTDPDLTESYRSDRADLVEAGHPMAVVLATTREHVIDVARWAEQWHVPVVARGAGTGLSGGAAAVDGGVVLSLAGMDKILEIAPDDQLAVVEPGVINADVSRAARQYGLFYPPDPSSFEISTIGGNLATNAGGLRCVRYGVTRESVLAMEVVLMGGRVVRCGARTVKSVSGYDLTRLFVGSEGTLGIIVSATLKLRPLPRYPPVTVVAEMPTLHAVGAAVSTIVSDGFTPTMLEMLDRACINAVEDLQPHGLDRETAALLIGQVDGPDAHEQAEAMVDVCRKAGATLAVASEDEIEADQLLAARRAAFPALERQGATLTEDVGVPRSKLVEMLAAIERVARAKGVRIATAGHAGDGNLHPTVIFDRDDPAAAGAALVAAEELCKEAILLGGTVSGEHGIGTLKRDWLHYEIDEDTRWAQRAVKAALDPQGLLNPGKAIC